MATFPGTIAYTDQVDGTLADVTDINDPFNTAYDAINALINGCDDLNDQVAVLENAVPVPGKFKLRCVYRSATTIDIEADHLMMYNPASTNWDQTLTGVAVMLNTAITGAGGIDYALPILASTWHTLWVICQDGGANPVALASQSIGSAPFYDEPDNLPATYTYYRRVGWFKTDAGANIIIFRHDYDSQLWIHHPTSAEDKVVSMALTVAYQVFDLSGGLPPPTRRALVQSYIYIQTGGGGAANVRLFVRENACGPAAGTEGYGVEVGHPGMLASDVDNDVNEIEVGCDASGRVEARLSNLTNLIANNLVISVKGWYDPT